MILFITMLNSYVKSKPLKKLRSNGTVAKRQYRSPIFS